MSPGRFDEPFEADLFALITAPGGGPASGRESPEFDTSVAQAARVWSYWLGGKDHYPADRAFADQIAGIHPDIGHLARADRAFLCRVVRYLAEQAGIRQFIDIGTGLPAVDNTHQVAQGIAPESRIVYVDNDPLVLSHARALLVGTAQGTIGHLDADLRDPGRILAGAAEILDFTRPVAVLLLGVLHFVDDHGQARAIVDHLVDALPAGSHLAIAHATDTVNGAAMGQVARQWRRRCTPPLTLRTPDQITAFFDRLQVLEPGVVSCSRWRPERGPFGTPPEVDHLCGLGRRP